MLHTEGITSGWVSRKQPRSERRWLIIKRRDKRGLTVRWHHSTLAAPPPSLKSTFRKSNETLVEKHWSTECSAPVWCLPVLLSQCEEHLICAVQLLAILHPGDLRLRHAFYCTAQPHLIPLRHRLIGRMLCEHHTCWSRRSRLDPFTQALQSESFLLSYWKFNTFSSADLCVCVFSTQQCFISNLTHFSELSGTASSSLTSSIRTSFRSCLRIYYFIFLQSLPDHWSIIWTFKGFMKIQELKQFNCFYFESLTETQSNIRSNQRAARWKPFYALMTSQGSSHHFLEGWRNGALGEASVKIPITNTNQCSAPVSRLTLWFSLTHKQVRRYRCSCDPETSGFRRDINKRV